jgi:acyl-CoA hydrolase
MADIADFTATQIARDTAQVDPYTRHDDMLDVLTALKPLDAAQINATFQKTSDADLIALFDDVYAKGDSGSQGLSFDEKRTLLTQLGSSLDATQLARVNARLSPADAAALADVVGEMQPQLAKDFASTQTHQLAKRDQRGVTGDGDGPPPSSSAEYESAPGGVPSRPPVNSRGTAADNQARDAILSQREIEGAASTSMNFGIDFVRLGLQSGVTTVQEIGLASKDAVNWVPHKIQDLGDKALQLNAIVTAAVRGHAPMGLQDRVQFKPESQLGRDLTYGAPSIFGGQASNAEIVARQVPIANLMFVAHDTTKTLLEGDATDIAESLGGLVVGGLLLERAGAGIRKLGGPAVEPRVLGPLSEPLPAFRGELAFDIEPTLTAREMPAAPAVAERLPAVFSNEPWPLEVNSPRPGVGFDQTMGIDLAVSRIERDHLARQSGQPQLPSRIAAISSDDPKIPPTGDAYVPKSPGNGGESGGASGIVRDLNPPLNPDGSPGTGIVPAGGTGLAAAPAGGVPAAGTSAPGTSLTPSQPGALTVPTPEPAKTWAVGWHPDVPAGAEVTFRMLPRPRDFNLHSKVAGAEIMDYLRQGSAEIGQRYTRQALETNGFTRFKFMAPVEPMSYLAVLSELPVVSSAGDTLSVRSQLFAWNNPWAPGLDPAVGGMSLKPVAVAEFSFRKPTGTQTVIAPPTNPSTTPFQLRSPDVLLPKAIGLSEDATLSHQSQPTGGQLNRNGEMNFMELMNSMDLAAAERIQHHGQWVVTAGIDNVKLHSPLLEGETLSVYTEMRVNWQPGKDPKGAVIHTSAFASAPWAPDSLPRLLADGDFAYVRRLSMTQGVTALANLPRPAGR